MSDGLAIEEAQADSQEDENEEDVDEYAVLKLKSRRLNKPSDGANEPKTKAKTTPPKTRVMKPKGDTLVRKTKPDASIDIAALIKESHVLDDNALFCKFFITPLRYSFY